MRRRARRDGSEPAAEVEAASTEDESLVGQLQYELMATREDLQSTNEELETSREDLQSLNEELTTVNNQLDDKVDELEATNNDLVNVLSYTDTATLFLDTELCIRRFDPATRRPGDPATRRPGDPGLLRVIDSDIGRPISDLAPRMNDPSLLDDARNVPAKLQPSEVTLLDDDGATFMRRILPYRTADNAIEGVVVTFTDVSNLQRVTDRLEVRERQQAAVTRLGEAALAGYGARFEVDGKQQASQPDVELEGRNALRGQAAVGKRLRFDRGRGGRRDAARGESGLAICARGRRL